LCAVRGRQAGSLFPSVHARAIVHCAVHHLFV
jgi:hypothetical protein